MNSKLKARLHDLCYRGCLLAELPLVLTTQKLNCTHSGFTHQKVCSLKCNAKGSTFINQTSEKKEEWESDKG